MGQTNQCCTLPFGQTNFNLNQIKIYWPQVAQQITKLRQQNQSLKLISQSPNANLPQQKSPKKHKKPYKQILTRDYYFFGYVDYASTQNNSFIDNNDSFSSTKQNFKKRKSSLSNQNNNNKQNNLTLSFLPDKLQLNDYGILIQKDKACYKGYFKNNMFHGRGYQSVIMNQKQQKFQGIYQNGKKKNGLYENQQFKYRGSFKNNQIQGKGKIQYKKTKQIYEGEIKNGKMNGKGKITYSNNDIYDGMLENGLFNGEGTYFWSTGEIYKGSYKKGKKHGFGVMIMENKVLQLCWVNDKAEGKPMNYRQYQTKRQTQTSKTKKTINNKNDDRKTLENDDAVSLMDFKARTQVLIK